MIERDPYDHGNAQRALAEKTASPAAPYTPKPEDTVEWAPPPESVELSSQLEG